MLKHIRKIVLGVLAIALVFGLAACGEPAAKSTAEKAADARNQGVDQIRTQQGVNPMSYSPTLATIDAWTKIWGRKGQVAYVYMKNNDGTLDGYYVFKGLPVNYCVSGSPTYDMVGNGGYSDGAYAKVPVPAPALDAAYYGGCDANRYYGQDAITGQIIEYEDGFIQTAVVSSSPLPLDKQPKAYVSSIEDVKQARK